MSSMDLLMWARGPALVGAVAIFVFGMVLRLFEIFSLGRKPDLAPPRSGGRGSGWRTLWARSIPTKPFFKVSMLTYVAGYTFHLGFFVVLLLLAPHIMLIRSVTGLHWPNLPTPLVDFVAVLSLLALIVTLVTRIMDPVKRFLSGVGDYVAWTVTFLPLLTGYMSYHHLLFDYTRMLAIHIMSVELLLIVFPFTKLTHMMSLFISRWYNGDWFARRGVAS